MRGILTLSLGLLCVFGSAGSALGDDIDPADGCVESPTCDTADVDFWWEHEAFQGVDLDTGWIPASSPVQLRFGVRVLGLTEIGMGGRLETSWPEALDMSVPGRDGTGTLHIAYGIELIARIRIDVEVLGTNYTWEGDLPEMIGIPADLLMESTADFDPFAFDEPGLSTASASDTTSRVPLYTFDITGGLINIPGIVGELRVEADAGLGAVYHTTRIVVDELDPITGSDGSTRYPVPASGDFDGAVDVAVHPEGVLDYTGTVSLYPHIQISILGVDIIDADIFALPLDLVNADVDVVFDAADVHVPLPDVGVQPLSVTLTDRDPAPVDLTVANVGEATLWVTPSTWPDSVAVSPAPFAIDPGNVVLLPLELTADARAQDLDTAGELVLATSDPDTPSLVVPLVLQADADGDPSDPTDPNDPDDGLGTPAAGCGCNGGPDPAGGGIAIALAMLWAIRGRRARAARRIE